MGKDVKIGLVVGVVLAVIILVLWMASQQGEEVKPSSVVDGTGNIDAPLGPDVPVELPEEPPVVADEPADDMALLDSPWEAPLEDDLDDPVVPVEIDQGEPEAPPWLDDPSNELPEEPFADDPPPLEPVAPPVSRQRTHTIASGDTLASIAEQYYGSQGKWMVIWEANKTTIPNPNRVSVGQVVTIPPLMEETPRARDERTTTEAPSISGRGERYTVKSGDSLYKIAEEKYGDGTKWKKIFEANEDRIEDESRLKVGQVILIPKL